MKKILKIIIKTALTELIRIIFNSKEAKNNGDNNTIRRSKRPRKRRKRL
jgi:hypothetical protein